MIAITTSNSIKVKPPRTGPVPREQLGWLELFAFIDSTMVMILVLERNLEPADECVNPFLELLGEGFAFGWERHEESGLKHPRSILCKKFTPAANRVS